MFASPVAGPGRGASPDCDACPWRLQVAARGQTARGEGFGWAGRLRLVIPHIPEGPAVANCINEFDCLSWVHDSLPHWPRASGSRVCILRIVQEITSSANSSPSGRGQGEGSQHAEVSVVSKPVSPGTGRLLKKGTVPLRHSEFCGHNARSQRDCPLFQQSAGPAGSSISNSRTSALSRLNLRVPEERAGHPLPAARFTLAVRRG